MHFKLHLLVTSSHIKSILCFDSPISIFLICSCLLRKIPMLFSLRLLKYNSNSDSFSEKLIFSIISLMEKPDSHNSNNFKASSFIEKISPFFKSYIAPLFAPPTKKQCSFKAKLSFIFHHILSFYVKEFFLVSG